MFKGPEGQEIDICHQLLGQKQLENVTADDRIKQAYGVNDIVIWSDLQPP